MEKRYILIFAMSVICGLSNVLAQSYTVDELQEMYNRKQYDRALPYLKYYAEAGNAEAMVLLGDCIRKIAFVNLEKVNRETGADLMKSNPYAYAMKMANTSVYEMQYNMTLQSQAIQNATDADYEASQLYYAAYKAGNSDAYDRIYMLSLQYPSISAPTQRASNSTTTSRGTQKCGYCNGTGVNPSPTSVAGYGSLAVHWCDVCKKDVGASHGAHLACPSCKGKGVK